MHATALSPPARKAARKAVKREHDPDNRVDESRYKLGGQARGLVRELVRTSMGVGRVIVKQGERRRFGENHYVSTCKKTRINTGLFICL